MSGSVPPRPMDLREPLDTLFTDIGGYWLCLRVRIARGADGWSIPPATAETVEGMLLCRVELLCRIKSEPLRPGLETGGRGPVIAFLASLVSLPIVPSAALSIIMLPGRLGSLPASGNGSSLCSSDAVNMLACRSSKLGEGRKSREPNEF